MIAILIGRLSVGQPLYEVVEYDYQTSFEQSIFENFIHQDEILPRQLLFSPSPEMTSERAQALDNQLESILKPIIDQREKLKNDRQFLWVLHTHLFATILKKYQTLSIFTQTLENGTYDCLTATLLFALALEQANMRYEIHEANYHVYLLVHTNDNKTYLIEATDRTKGIITNADEVAARIAEYSQKYNQVNTFGSENNYHQATFAINRQINLKQLAVLQYYNCAVAAYNAKNWNLCISHLEKTMRVYQQERTSELMVMALERLLNDEGIFVSEKQALKSRQRFYMQKLLAAH